jgi:chromosomal replication initiation ATPase DnaA
MTDPRVIVRAVAAFHGLSMDELLRPNRQQGRVRARWEAMWQLRASGLSLPAVGRAMGGMHHTTVLHGLRMADRLMEKRRRWLSILPVDRPADWVGRLLMLHSINRAELVVAQGAGL